MLRAVLHSVVHFLFIVLTRLEVHGKENIPSQGAAILASNHVSRLDPALGFVLIERKDATSLVGEKYQEKPFFRFLIDAAGGIFINRQQADLRALRAALDHLAKGGILGIAPEGTRSHNGALIPAKTGVAYLADKAGAPIVPIGITGTEKVFHELYRLRRQRVIVRFGKPFTLLPLEHSDRNAGMQRNTDEIMCQIAALLPPEYRGVYADHPRLKEIAGSGELGGA